MDVSYWEGQASWASQTFFFTPGQLSIEFVNVGGWLTHGILLWILVLSSRRLLSTG